MYDMRKILKILQKCIPISSHKCVKLNNTKSFISRSLYCWQKPYFFAGNEWEKTRRVVVSKAVTDDRLAQARLCQCVAEP
jgi:hypothetical protein